MIKVCIFIYELTECIYDISIILLYICEIKVRLFLNMRGKSNFRYLRIQFTCRKSVHIQYLKNIFRSNHRKEELREQFFFFLSLSTYLYTLWLYETTTTTTTDTTTIHSDCLLYMYHVYTYHGAMLESAHLNEFAI